MAASIHYTAVVPKELISAARGQAAIDKVLATFQVEIQKRMQAYPAAQPWKNPPPKTGLRAGGRRTGTYGRNWASGANVTRDKASVTVENRTPYAAWVGGSKGKRPGQARALAARGWTSVDTAGPAALKAAAAKFKY